MTQAPADKLLLVLTALFTGGLAAVAGAVSFAHMQELATAHDQLGWKSYAFPVSVDGLEVVASFYLVAARRAGRPAGWTAWVALIVGTLASLAANVTACGADSVGKALAGWPAVSMLVSVKLLFSRLGYTNDSQRAVPDSQRTSPPSWTCPGPSRTASQPRGPSRPAARTSAPWPNSSGGTSGPRHAHGQRPGGVTRRARQRHARGRARRLQRPRLPPAEDPQDRG